MKNCPFCNAVLADEANFCLYCMSSLDEKKKTAAIEKKKRKALPIILILTATLLCLVSAFVIITYKDNKDEYIPGQSLNNRNDNSDESSVYPDIAYTYRTAVIGDDYSSAYTPEDNDIIITGVETAEPSGIYYIPEHIDGKRVLGIDPLAFSDENIRDSVVKVILSDGIKTVWENAFASCVNMSDIYLMGEAVYIDVGAFSQTRNGSLTIHCSETCNDRNFRLYINKEDIYGAVYEYWDGGDLS